MSVPFTISKRTSGIVCVIFNDGSIFKYFPNDSYPHAYQGPLRDDCCVGEAVARTRGVELVYLEEMLDLLRDTVANAGLELVRQKLTEG